MQLRGYQQEAIDRTYEFFRHNAPELQPVLSLATGLGKSVIAMQFAHDVHECRNGRTIILAHRKELLAQVAGKISVGEVSVYSASLGSKSTSGDTIVAQIQSCYRKAAMFGSVDLVVVDEAHMVSPDDETMFARFLGELRDNNPLLRVVGLTATPYRMKEGSIVGPDGPFHAVAYEYGIGEGVRDGYLAPLTSFSGSVQADTSGVHMRGGEFIAGELAQAVEPIVLEACDDIKKRAATRQSIIVFCCSVAHAEQVAERLDGVCVHGGTPQAERDQIIEDFKAEKIRVMTNCEVLTTGFDAPNVDCIALLRPTASRGLFIQMVGRGTRLHPNKGDCLVLDYGGNVRRHGPVDAPYEAPRKVWSADGPRENAYVRDWECPQCGRLNSTGFSQCDACDYVRTRPIGHEAEAANEAIMMSAGIQPAKRQWLDVLKTRYFVHVPRDANKQKTLLVEYEVDELFPPHVRQWVCPQHSGYARKKFEEWWAKRSNDPAPSTVAEALQLANIGALADTIQIKADLGGTYPQVLEEKVGPKPSPVTADTDDKWWEGLDEIDEDELPF